MRVWWWLIAGLLLMTLVAAAPGQEGRPPSPLEPDYYSGTVTVQGSPPAEGTLLVACINGCDQYQTDYMKLPADGTFDWLVVGPQGYNFVSQPVLFYLVNEFGSVQAAESNTHAAARNRFEINLTFAQQLPTDYPTPTPPPTPTPLPTATPLPPTPTPMPTPTPVPTATPAPTPTPTPIPPPTPTAILPVTGDPVVTSIPPVIIAVGIALAVAGAALLLYSLRKRSASDPDPTAD